MAIKFDHGGILIEDASELPEFDIGPGAAMFLDMETTSFDRGEMSVNPWRKCWPLGIAIKFEGSAAYYVPLNHETGNVDKHAAQAWLIDIFERVVEQNGCWVNHNVKYDAHVLHNTFGIDTTKIKKYCTLDLAKMVDSDRWTYSLEALSYDWLKHDISHHGEIFKPYLVKNKDFGLIPADLMGNYACQDVLTEESLWKHIVANMPVESLGIMETSSELVDCFLEIERNGMRIDPTEVAKQELIALQRMLEIQAEIQETIGYSVEPHTNKDCFDVLCNHFGLPVLEWTETGQPSFDRKTFEKYKSQPGAPLKIIDLMLEYRRLTTFTSVFTKTYRLLHIDGLLHCSYNPTVRTGRSSCSLPNMQQLMMEAKKLIIPGEGNVIISCDFRQIEFIMIAHYINDEKIIEAYERDPFTDFHQLVGDMCHIGRKPGKQINFTIGYGGGKKTLVAALIMVPELVGEILDDVNAMDIPQEEKQKLFQTLAMQRAEEAYNTYHETLPGLKRVTRAATSRIYERGYVINKYGRHRRLPAKAAHKAFNSLCQGTAADLMKERLVALWKWFKSEYPEAEIIGVVHDEAVIRVPQRIVCDHLLDGICFVLEDTSESFRLPIRTSLGISDKDWYEASENDKIREFDRNTFKISRQN